MDGVRIYMSGCMSAWGLVYSECKYRETQERALTVYTIRWVARYYDCIRRQAATRNGSPVYWHVPDLLLSYVTEQSALWTQDGLPILGLCDCRVNATPSCHAPDPVPAGDINERRWELLIRSTRHTNISRLKVRRKLLWTRVSRTTKIAIFSKSVLAKPLRAQQNTPPEAKPPSIFA